LLLPPLGTRWAFDPPRPKPSIFPFSRPLSRPTLSAPTPGAGHYISFVRPVGSRGEWYKFDDTRVYRVPEETAVAHQFGVGSGPNSGRGLFGLAGGSSPPCAYMLTYVRQAESQAAEAAVEASHGGRGAGGALVLGGAPAAEAGALPGELREAFEVEIANKRRKSR
jgi:hypothetical protein